MERRGINPSGREYSQELRAPSREGREYEEPRPHRNLSENIQESRQRDPYARERREVYDNRDSRNARDSRNLRDPHELRDYGEVREPYPQGYQQREQIYGDPREFREGREFQSQSQLPSEHSTNDYSFGIGKNPSNVLQTLMTENKKLKDNFETLRTEYDKLREFHTIQMKQWRETIKDKTLEFENLRVASNTSAQTLQEITQRYYEELEMRKQLEMRLDQLQNTEHENKQLLQQLKTFEHNQEEMKLRMQRDFISKETILENRISRLQSQYDTIASEKNQIVLSLKTSEELLLSLEEMKSKSTQLEIEISELRRSSEFELKEKDDRILSLKREVTTIGVHLQSLETEVASKDRKIVLLEKNNFELQNDKESELKRRKEYEAEVLKLRAQLDDLTIRLETERKEFKRHESFQISELTNERNHLRSQLSEIRHKFDSLQFQKQEIIQNHINTDSIEVEKLKFEVKTLQNQLKEEKDKKHQQLQELYTKEALQKGQLHTLQSRLDAQSEKMSTIRVEKEQLEIYINELKARLSSTEHELESTRLQLHSLEMNHEDLRHQYDQLKKIVSDSESQQIKIISKSDRDSMEINHLQKQIEDLQLNIKKLKSEKIFITDKAKQKMKELTKDKRSIENNLEEERKEIKNLKSKYNKRISLLTEQIDSLKTEVSREKEKLQQAKKREFDLEQEWQKKCFELKREKDKYRAILESSNFPASASRFSHPISTSPIKIGSDSSESVYSRALKEYEELATITKNIL